MLYINSHLRRVAAGVFCCVAALVFSWSAQAQVIGEPFDPLSFGPPDPAEQFSYISIEQRLEAQVPLDLTFVDEGGHQVQLGDFLGDRPAILALVYYECPMLCNLVLDGVEAALDAMSLEVGKDFDVITVSIDPGETPELAAQKKANHLERLGKEGAERGWHFLTGDEVGIERLADAVGFRFTYDPATDLYAHAAGIMVLTPMGQVSRYYYGIDYIPRDVRFGLVEASEGRIGNVVDQLLLLCFAYDPSTGKYGLVIFRTIQFFATLMILGFAAMYTLLYLKSRKKKKDAGPKGGDLADSTHDAAH